FELQVELLAEAVAAQVALPAGEGAAAGGPAEPEAEHGGDAGQLVGGHRRAGPLGHLLTRLIVGDADHAVAGPHPVADVDAHAVAAALIRAQAALGVLDQGRPQPQGAPGEVHAEVEEADVALADGLVELLAHEGRRDLAPAPRDLDALGPM